MEEISQKEIDYFQIRAVEMLYQKSSVCNNLLPYRILFTTSLKISSSIFYNLELKSVIREIIVQ